MRKKIIAILMTVLAAGVQAEDLNSWLEKAIVNDLYFQIFEKQVENERLNTDIENLSEVFGLSFTTDSNESNSTTSDRNGLTATWNSGLTLTGTPELTATLGDPLQSQISIFAPFSYSSESSVENEGLTVSPGISMSQSLNRLFNREIEGEEPEILTALNNLYQVREAELNLLERGYAVRIELLQILKYIYSLISSMKGLDVDILEAEETLEEAVNLKKYTADSSQMKRLEFNHDKRIRELESSKIEYRSLIAELEDLVNQKVDNLPSIPAIEPVLPEEPMVEMNPDWFLADLQAQIEQIGLMEAGDSYTPEYRITGAYSNEISSSGVEHHDLSGTLTGAFENFTLSLTAGGIIDGYRPYISAGFSWNLPDKRADEITLSRYQNSLTIAELARQEAENNFTTNIKLFTLDLETMRIQQENLVEETLLLGNEMEEAEKWFSLGLISELELTEYRWNKEEKEYDQIILNIDKILKQIEINKLLINREVI